MLPDIVRHRSVGCQARRAIGFLCLPAAVWVQYLLDRRGVDGNAWAVVGLVLVGALLAFNQWDEGRAQSLSSRVLFGGRPWHTWATWLGATMSLGSYACFGGNRLTAHGVLLWQVGLALFVVGACALDIRGWLQSRLQSGYPRFRIRWPDDLAMLAIITGLGAVYRLWAIDSLPAEPGVDLPLIFRCVESVLAGDWPIYFTYHPGREGLYLYLAAGYVRLVGLSYPALRSVGALLGTTTIPVVYLAGRRLFNREVGLLAAGLLAVSRWHVILSRTGLRFILMPVFTLLLVAVLDWALAQRRPLRWACVGWVLGWGFHTYSAWLVMPAVLAVAVLLHRLCRRQWNKADLFLLLLALDVAGLLYVPLARFAHDNPQLYTLRVASRLTDRETTLPPDMVETLWRNLARTAGMFNVLGDSVAHINVPFKRHLGLVSGATFLMGCGVLVGRWRRSQLLLVMLLGASLPSALSLAFPGEVPNAGRASGAVGLACIIAAVALSRWCREARVWLEGLTPSGRRRLMSCSAMALIVVGLWVVEGLETRADYFAVYPKTLSGGNYPISSRLAETIVQYSRSGQVFLVAFPHFYDGNALRTQLELEGVQWENEMTSLDVESPPWQPGDGLVVVILHPEDRVSLQALSRRMPEAAVVTHLDNHGAKAFLTLFPQP
jgi:4-amino-4-deoxy-L-arabinose transferase-like glycosyltransferase